jgi:hypothetical protein
VKETGIDLRLEKDHVNLLEAFENLFLYLRDMDQRIDSSQHYQLPADWCQMLPEELRRRRREFRSRVFAYSNLSPKLIAHQPEGPSKLEKSCPRCPENCGNAASQGRDRTNPEEDARSIVRMISGKLGETRHLT